MASIICRKCTKCHNVKDRDKDFAPSTWVCHECSQQVVTDPTAVVHQSDATKGIVSPRSLTPKASGARPLGLLAELWMKIWEFIPESALSLTCRQFWESFGLKYVCLDLNLEDDYWGAGCEREYSSRRAYLRSMKQLEKLKDHIDHLLCMSIHLGYGPAEQLSILQQASQLTMLRLMISSYTNASGVVIDPLHNLKELKHLALELHFDATFTPQLAQLSELRHLESLYLHLLPVWFKDTSGDPELSAEVTQAIANLATLPALQSLDIGLLKINDVSAAPLAKLKHSPQLLTLAFKFVKGQLSSNGIAALKEITSAPSLRSLRINVKECDVSECLGDLQVLTGMSDGPRITVELPQGDAS